MLVKYYFTLPISSIKHTCNMISKKTLSIYGHKTIEEYFEMTVESKINGQFGQFRAQFVKMSPEQRLQFIEYCDRMNIEVGVDEYSEAKGYVLRNIAKGITVCLIAVSLLSSCMATKSTIEKYDGRACASEKAYKQSVGRNSFRY